VRGGCSSASPPVKTQNTPHLRMAFSSDGWARYICTSRSASYQTDQKCAMRPADLASSAGSGRHLAEPNHPGWMGRTTMPVAGAAAGTGRRYPRRSWRGFRSSSPRSPWRPDRGHATYTEVEESEADSNASKNGWPPITARDYFQAPGGAAASSAVQQCREATGSLRSRRISRRTRRERYRHPPSAHSQLDSGGRRAMTGPPWVAALISVHRCLAAVLARVDPPHSPYAARAAGC
jgi:hypothetical protein